MIKTFTQSVYDMGVFVQKNTLQYNTNKVKPNCLRCKHTFKNAERNYQERGNFCIKCDNILQIEGLENQKEINKLLTTKDLITIT